ncbi:MAG: hypothetical protein ACREQV_08730, partial [Candidatus Binatia bacterium]
MADKNPACKWGSCEKIRSWFDRLTTSGMTQWKLGYLAHTYPGLSCIQGNGRHTVDRGASLVESGHRSIHA